MLLQKRKRYLISALIFVVLALGTIVGFILLKNSQDVRQQASGGCEAGDPYCSCDAWGSNCILVDPEGTRQAVEQGSEENKKGILATSYTGERATTEGACGGVWMNAFCYMPGDEIAGGYVVLESGRHDYPYLEKKTTYESLNFGGETIDNRTGTVESLGEDCGGNSYRIGNNCYAYGAVVNGYLVMPDRTSDCDNSTGDYCYAHLKKIDVAYSDWQNAVNSYEETGNSDELEELYKRIYGIPFQSGLLYDSQASNADLLRAQALIASLTSAEVLQRNAQEENDALEAKGNLNEEEQAIYDFNQRIIDYPDLAKNYQVLDQLNDATSQKITVNNAISQMYSDLVIADGDANLNNLAKEKFKEIFGYDPSGKYGNLNGILGAFGIDPTQLNRDRNNYANEVAIATEEQNQNIDKLNQEYQEYVSGQSANIDDLKQAALDAGLITESEISGKSEQDLLALLLSKFSGTTLSQEIENATALINSRKSNELASDYLDNQGAETAKNDLLELYELYVGHSPTYRMTTSELEREIAKYNSQIALSLYVQTQDVSYLDNYFTSNFPNAPASQLTRVLGDPKALLNSIYGATGNEIYKDFILPTNFEEAISNFPSDSGASLIAVCRDLGVTNCDIDSTNPSITLSLMLDEMYGDQEDVNIPELAAAYSNQIVDTLSEDKKEKYWDVVFANMAMGFGGDGLAMASLVSDTAAETFQSNLNNQSEAMANYSLAAETVSRFSGSTFEYAVNNKASISDYTFGMTMGNAFMWDNIANRKYDLETDLGLVGWDKFSMGWNQVETQIFGVNNAKNIATNYAAAANQNYVGPVNTNVADLAMQAASNLKIADFDDPNSYIQAVDSYTAANDGYYFSQGLNNVGATLADWAVTAGTYLALSNQNTSPSYYGSTAGQNILSYQEIADQATKAGDEVRTNIQNNFYTQQAANYVNQDQLQGISNPDIRQSIINEQVQDFVAFQTDSEIIRSRQELNWETVEKVVAPTVAVIALPIAIASGAGIGVVAGIASSAFSLYQGAGMKAQALDAQTVAIGRYGYEDRVNVAAQNLANNPVIDQKTGETVTYTYDEALELIEAQNKMLNQQANMMLASSAVGALTSGAGIINGFAKGAQVALASGQAISGASQFALNTASAMGTAGRIGGIGLSAINVVNSSQTLFDANASAEEKWMSGLSTFVAASGAIGNSFGFIKNPAGTTKAITTWGDMILDVASVPSGVAVDMQQVSKACYDDDYPGDEGACRNAWVGLALSLTQDLAQVGNSAASFNDYRANYKATDSLQRINSVDTEINKILSNTNRSIGDNLKLGELQLHRESLVASALAINSSLKIPEAPVTTLSKTNVAQIKTEDLMQTAAQNRSNLLSRAAELEQSNPDLAVQLRQQADDVFNRQLEISSLGDQIRAIDKAIDQDFDKLSTERIEELRETRSNLVAELDNKANDPAYQAHNLSVENKQLAISLKENEVFKAYDEFRSLEQEQIRIQDQNIPPPVTNLTKQTGIVAAIIPKIAEQNRALDLVEAQNKVAEIQRLNLEKNQLEGSAETEASLLRIEEINKLLTDANTEFNKIIESTADQGFWQRIRNILPGSKTERNYNEAILALKDINQYNQDNIRLEQLSDKHLNGNLSNEERQEFNRLLDDLEGADQRYTQSQEKISQALTKVTNSLQNSQGSFGAIAFINRAAEGIKNIFSPSNSKKQFNLQTELKISKNDLDLLSQHEKLIGDLSKYQEGLAEAEKAINQVPEEQKLVLQQDIDAYKQKIEAAQNDLTRIESSVDIKETRAKYFQTIIDAEQQKVLEAAFNSQDLTAFRQEVENIKNTALDRLELSNAEKALVEQLIASKEIINNSQSKTTEEINQARTRYAESLTELSKSILGGSPDFEAYQRLGEVQSIIKRNDLLGTIKEDSNIGEVLASQEIRLNTDDPLVAAKMANIVREMEFRTGATEGVPFFNSRTNQVDTMLKILSGNRVAVELTTAGGKTFVGAAVLKIQQEIIGYETGIYIAKPGQEADIQKSMAIAYGVDLNKIPILDNSKLSDKNYIESLKEAAFIIADPSQIQFIRNTALNVKDPNFKTAVEIYSKLSKNASIYVDELQITLDPSRQAINSVGPSTQDIPQSYKDTANLIGRVLDQTVLKDGGWGLGDNSFLVLRTQDGAEIAKFSKSAQGEIFTRLAEETGISSQKYGIITENATEIERALNQGEDVLVAKLTELGVTDVTTSKVNQVLDQVDMLNSFAQGLKMQRGTDYIRAVDGVLSKNGGPNRNVTIPAAGGVSNEGQSYKANLQVAMEYIGARAYGDDVNFSGLKSSPNEAFRSNISSYFASLKNSSVGAVTGAMADGAGVVEVSLGLTTYRSTEAVDKIIGIEGVAGGGRVVAERSYAIGRGQDVDAVVALKNSHKLDTSDGRASNGNLKIVMGTDGAEDPIKFAINLAGTDAFKNSEFAVQNPDGTYSKINIQDGQVSSEPITTKQIQDLYDRGAQNLVTIIGRGGATGDSIKTAGNIPGITITSSKTPVGLVAQAGARIDRGDEIADQYALIIAPGASKVSIDKPMTSADFSQFKNEIVNNQKIVEQAKNTQALDQGVTTASNKVLENLIFESSDAKVQEWASNLLLKFSTEEGLRDLDLDGGSQTSLAARQKKVEAEIIKWKEVLADPANASILKQIASNNPELYKTILTNAGVKSKLAYAGAGAQANTTKEAVITADNLEDFIRRHNLFVTSDAESKVVASSGRQVETEQIATKNQQNSNEANKAEAELNTTKDTIKDLANVVANPIKMAIELGNGNIVREVLKTPSRIINYAKNLDAIQENAINNYRAQRETLANLITNLEAETDVNLQADLQQQIDNLEKEIAAVPLLTKASNFVNERVIGEGKGRVASVLNFFTNLFSSEEITPEVIAQKDKAINDLKITDKKALADLANLKTAEEIANFVAAKQTAYQKLKDQFAALNTVRPAINNEEEYKAQEENLNQTLSEIKDLQDRSGLKFIEIAADGTISRVNEDQFKNLSTFRARAEVQIEKLAKEAVLTTIATIGRDSNNSLRTMSRSNNIADQHAQILRNNENGNLYIRDLLSNTGTYVNGRKIEAEKNILLLEGDIVLLGDSSNTTGIPFKVIKDGDNQLNLAVLNSNLILEKPITIALSDLNNFDPVKGLDDLFKADRSNRSAMIAKYKENLVLQKQGIASTQDFIISTLEKNPDLNIYNFIEEVKSYALNKGLNLEQISNISGLLRSYESKRQRAEEIIDLSDNPKVLFEKAFNIKPIGKVNVKRINHQVVFYVDPVDLGRAHDGLDSAININSGLIKFIQSGILFAKDSVIGLINGSQINGFYSTYSDIPNSKGQILVIKNNPVNVEQEQIVTHELRHSFIRLFMERGIFGASVSKEITDKLNNIDPTSNNFSVDEFNQIANESLYEMRKTSENELANEFMAQVSGLTKNRIDSSLEKNLLNDLNSAATYQFIERDGDNYSKPIIYEKFVPKDENYVQSYLGIVEKYFGTKAQTQLINDAISAYNSLIDKGYSQEETFAILQSVRVDYWLKNADRMPSLIDTVSSNNESVDDEAKNIETEITAVEEELVKLDQIKEDQQNQEIDIAERITLEERANLELLAQSYGDINEQVQELNRQINDAKLNLSKAQEQENALSEIMQSLEETESNSKKLQSEIENLQKQREGLIIQSENISKQINSLSREIRASITEKDQALAAQKVRDNLVLELDKAIDQSVRALAIQLSKKTNIDQEDANRQISQIISNEIENFNFAQRLAAGLRSLPEFQNDVEGADAYAKDILSTLTNKRFISKHMAPDRLQIEETQATQKNITAIGDVHGDWDALVRLLSGQVTNEKGQRISKSLVDKKGNWIGGENDSLILTGDLFDRAPDGVNSAQTAERIMRLQKQAGNLSDGTPRVKVLLGNHDVNAILAYWNMKNFISKEGYSKKQAAEIGSFTGMRPGITADDLTYLYNNQELIDWAMSLDAMTIDNGTLYMHSDITGYDNYGKSVDEVNNNIRAIIQGKNGLEALRNLMSVLTDRGHLNSEDNVSYLLNTYGANHIVHGHSQGETSFDPRVDNIDGGLSEKYAKRLGLGQNRGRFYAQSIPGLPGVNITINQNLPDQKLESVLPRPLSNTMIQVDQQSASNIQKLEQLRSESEKINLEVDGVDLQIEEKESNYRVMLLAESNLQEKFSSLNVETSVAEAKKSLANLENRLAEQILLLGKAKELLEARKEITDLLDALRGAGMKVGAVLIEENALGDVTNFGQKLLGLMTEAVNQQLFAPQDSTGLINSIIRQSISLGGIVSGVNDAVGLIEKLQTAFQEAQTLQRNAQQKLELIDEINTLINGSNQNQTVIDDDLLEMSVEELESILTDLKTTQEQDLEVDEVVIEESTKLVEENSTAQQVSYQNLKNQFAALNTVRPAINNEEEYKAQEENLNQTLSEIKDLQDRSGLKFIEIAADGTISRVNEDQFKNLSTFRARAEVQIEKLAKEAEQKAQEEKLLAEEKEQQRKLTARWQAISDFADKTFEIVPWGVAVSTLQKEISNINRLIAVNRDIDFSTVSSDHKLVFDNLISLATQFTDNIKEQNALLQEAKRLFTDQEQFNALTDLSIEDLREAIIQKEAEIDGGEKDGQLNFNEELNYQPINVEEDNIPNKSVEEVRAETNKQATSYRVANSNLDMVDIEHYAWARKQLKSKALGERIFQVAKLLEIGTENKEIDLIYQEINQRFVDQEFLHGKHLSLAIVIDAINGDTYKYNNDNRYDNLVEGQNSTPRQQTVFEAVANSIDAILSSELSGQDTIGQFGKGIKQALTWLSSGSKDKIEVFSREPNGQSYKVTIIKDSQGQYYIQTTKINLEDYLSNTKGNQQGTAIKIFVAEGIPVTKNEVTTNQYVSQEEVVGGLHKRYPFVTDIRINTQRSDEQVSKYINGYETKQQLIPQGPIKANTQRTDGTQRTIDVLFTENTIEIIDNGKGMNSQVIADMFVPQSGTKHPEPLSGESVQRELGKIKAVYDLADDSPQRLSFARNGEVIMALDMPRDVVSAATVDHNFMIDGARLFDVSDARDAIKPDIPGLNQTSNFQEAISYIVTKISENQDLETSEKLKFINTITVGLEKISTDANAKLMLDIKKQIRETIIPLISRLEQDGVVILPHFVQYEKINLPEGKSKIVYLDPDIFDWLGVASMKKAGAEQIPGIYFGNDQDIPLLMMDFKIEHTSNLFDSNGKLIEEDPGKWLQVVTTDSFVVIPTQFGRRLTELADKFNKDSLSEAEHLELKALAQAINIHTASKVVTSYETAEKLDRNANLVKFDVEEGQIDSAALQSFLQPKENLLIREESLEEDVKVFEVQKPSSNVKDVPVQGMTGLIFEERKLPMSATTYLGNNSYSYEVDGQLYVEQRFIEIDEFSEKGVLLKVEQIVGNKFVGVFEDSNSTGIFNANTGKYNSYPGNLLRLSANGKYAATVDKDKQGRYVAVVSELETESQKSFYIPGEDGAIALDGTSIFVFGNEDEGLSFFDAENELKGGVEYSSLKFKKIVQGPHYLVLEDFNGKISLYHFGEQARMLVTGEELPVGEIEHISSVLNRGGVTEIVIRGKSGFLSKGSLRSIYLEELSGELTNDPPYLLTDSKSNFIYDVSAKRASYKLSGVGEVISWITPLSQKFPTPVHRSDKSGLIIINHTTRSSFVKDPVSDLFYKIGGKILKVKYNNSLQISEIYSHDDKNIYLSTGQEGIFQSRFTAINDFLTEVVFNEKTNHLVFQSNGKWMLFDPDEVMATNVNIEDTGINPDIYDQAWVKDDKFIFYSSSLDKSITYNSTQRRTIETKTIASDYANANTVEELITALRVRGKITHTTGEERPVDDLIERIKRVVELKKNSSLQARALPFSFAITRTDGLATRLAMILGLDNAEGFEGYVMPNSVTLDSNYKDYSKEWNEKVVGKDGENRDKIISQAQTVYQSVVNSLPEDIQIDKKLINEISRELTKAYALAEKDLHDQFLQNPSEFEFSEKTNYSLIDYSQKLRHLSEGLPEFVSELEANLIGQPPQLRRDLYRNLIENIFEWVSSERGEIDTSRPVNHNFYYGLAYGWNGISSQEVFDGTYDIGKFIQEMNKLGNYQQEVYKLVNALRASFDISNINKSTIILRQLQRFLELGNNELFVDMLTKFKKVNLEEIESSVSSDGINPIKDGGDVMPFIQFLTNDASLVREVEKPEVNKLTGETIQLSKPVSIPAIQKLERLRNGSGVITAEELIESILSQKIYDLDLSDEQSQADLAELLKNISVQRESGAYTGEVTQNSYDATRANIEQGNIEKGKLFVDFYTSGNEYVEEMTDNGTGAINPLSLLIPKSDKQAGAQTQSVGFFGTGKFTIYEGADRVEMITNNGGQALKFSLRVVKNEFGKPQNVVLDGLTKLDTSTTPIGVTIRRIKNKDKSLPELESMISQRSWKIFAGLTQSESFEINVTTGYKLEDGQTIPEIDRIQIDKLETLTETKLKVSKRDSKPNESEFFEGTVRTFEADDMPLQIVDRIGLRVTEYKDPSTMSDDELSKSYFALIPKEYLSHFKELGLIIQIPLPLNRDRKSFANEDFYLKEIQKYVAISFVKSLAYKRLNYSSSFTFYGFAEDSLENIGNYLHQFNPDKNPQIEAIKEVAELINNNQIDSVNINDLVKVITTKNENMVNLAKLLLVKDINSGDSISLFTRRLNYLMEIDRQQAERELKYVYDKESSSVGDINIMDLIAKSGGDEADKKSRIDTGKTIVKAHDEMSHPERYVVAPSNVREKTLIEIATLITKLLYKDFGIDEVRLVKGTSFAGAFNFDERNSLQKLLPRKKIMYLNISRAYGLGQEAYGGATIDETIDIIIHELAHALEHQIDGTEYSSSMSTHQAIGRFADAMKYLSGRMMTEYDQWLTEGGESFEDIYRTIDQDSILADSVIQLIKDINGRHILKLPTDLSQVLEESVDLSRQEIKPILDSLRNFISGNKQLEEYEQKLNLLSNQADNKKFSNLCSDCNQVRLSTQAGVEKVDALIQESESLLKQAEEAKNAGDQVKADELNKQAESKKQEALKQLNNTRFQVINSHGMQNQCVQLYLNAWVDTREALIRKTRADINNAIDSVYKATVLAEEMMDQKQMAIKTNTTFGLGGKVISQPLSSEEVDEIADLLFGNKAKNIEGLQSWAAFDTGSDGKFNKKVLKGSLLDLDNTVVTDQVSPIRVFLRKFAISARQIMILDNLKTKLSSFVDVDEEQLNISITPAITLTITPTPSISPTPSVSPTPSISLTPSISPTQEPISPTPTLAMSGSPNKNNFDWHLVLNIIGTTLSLTLFGSIVGHLPIFAAPPQLSEETPSAIVEESKETSSVVQKPTLSPTVSPSPSLTPAPSKEETAVVEEKQAELPQPTKTVALDTTLPNQENLMYHFAKYEILPNGEVLFTSRDEWIPVDPNILPNYTTNRNTTDYLKTIEFFQVEESMRYRRNSSITYCNIYVADVTKALGVPIPRWQNGEKMDADEMYYWLQDSFAQKELGWREVTAQEAQALANSGIPAVAATPRYAVEGGTMPGHVAMVIPGQGTTVEGEFYPASAQAGNLNFDDGSPTSVGFARALDNGQEIRYFVNESTYEFVQPDAYSNS